ncbi:MAG: DUF1918 domain-containing protein [Thermoleophilia bacterium]|nr:DUF1918 domain-containing protein [Thermoleophilia bacterium]
MEAKELQGVKDDRIIIKAHRVGESPRARVVLEVLGKPDHIHYRVRWDENGHESREIRRWCWSRSSAGSRSRLTRGCRC